MTAILKKTGLLFLLLALISCGETIVKNRTLDSFIPENPSIVFKISNFEALKTDLGNNSLSNLFSKSQPYAFFQENATILKHLKPDAESLLSINKLNDSTTAYTFITRESADLFVIDSLPNKTVETLTYNNKTLQRITIDEKTAYVTVKDSVFIASSSQLLLQKVLDDEKHQSAGFKKIYSIEHSGDLSVMFPANKISINGKSDLNFATYIGLDAVILPDAVHATGVALARDTIPQLLSVFNEQIPQQNDIAKVVPNNAINVTAFTFNDADLIKKNLSNFRATPAIENTGGIFESCNEIGQITFKNGNAIVLKSIDPSLTNIALAKFISEGNTFRDVSLSNFSELELFSRTFAPLIAESSPKFMFQLDNFFIFTETENTAEEIISAFKNNNTLSKSNYFDVTASQLSTSSSLLFFGLNGRLPQLTSSFFDLEGASDIENTSLKNYPLTALQFSYDRDFAHVNFVCNEASEAKKTLGNVSEEFNLTLENQLLSEPQLFTNHRTKGKDIVVQDVANNLYLISASGKVLWKEKLDSPILGEIQEIDILRNGKKQLAFATRTKFHVLDRTGKEVAPFPINFKDPITQPLAVFDYDNNRKYRFVIVQDRDVLMYDADAKIVKGFTFTKASSKIVLPPQHIRMSNKDYIVIPEENGKLNILSRVGKTRVEVSKKFNFSEMPIAKENNNFVVITQEESKESISQSGKITSLKLDVSEDYSFSVTGSIKVTLNDNLLRINGRLVELPFGIYTRPKTYYANKTTYVTVTETQENKVYVFDKSGTLLSGFPVYGTSQAAIGNITSRNKLGVIVKGAGKEIICYSLQ